MRDDMEVVAVNDPFLDPSYMSYMLQYDSVHGRLAADVTYDDSSFTVDGQKVQVSTERCATRHRSTVSRFTGAPITFVFTMDALCNRIVHEGCCSAGPTTVLQCSCYPTNNVVVECESFVLSGTLPTAHGVTTG